MKKRVTLSMPSTMLGVVLLTAFAGMTTAQTKPAKPTKPKSTVKPAPPKPPVAAPTKGTAQLAGDNGKLGVTYQLGDQNQELHFTLESAQFAPFYKTPEGSAVIAGAEQRLLVLTFFVQNPQKRDMGVGFNSFNFTAVSPDDKNFKTNQWLYQPEGGKSYSADLKPAQKVRLQVVIPLYATGPIRKIMVQRGSGAVLRYDLLDKVGKMKTTFSPDGLDMLSDANAELVKPFDMSGVEMEVQEIKSHTEAFGRFRPYNKESVILTATVKYTNLLLRPTNFYWATFRPELTDENGEKIEWQQDWVSIGTQSSLNQEVAPGESLRGMFVFKGLKSQKPARLRLRDERTKRTVTIKLP
jgi:hypothetical protein